MASKTVQKFPKNKWAIDFTTRPKCMTEKSKSEIPGPVGYADYHSYPTVETHDADLSKLVAKKSWNIALAPMKQLPMNLFIMYMAGNSISIFPIMIVGMMIFKPIKAMLTLKSTFKMLDGEQGILLKFTYLLGNILCLLLAVYKCHSMGILPTAPSDWLAFKEHRQRVDYIVGGIQL
ncbi:ER membrane protein complex subunit 4-like [Rhopilema esculentum]|uniref:ER membrane protein complex subunit 4-like n=1 Tax=Rhopilema esculentum TaxID=499914 RepID=UPI0031D3812E